MAVEKTKKKHKRTKNQKALNFLCIMMAFVVIFVAVVCISVDKKNDALREKEMLDKLRCRNGNLEIVVAKQESTSMEL